MKTFKAMMLVVAAGLLTVLLVACRMVILMENGNPQNSDTSAAMDARKEVGVSPTASVAMPGGKATTEAVTVGPSSTAAPVPAAEAATPVTPTVRK